MSGKIIVIAEQFDGKIKPVSLELAGFGKEISQTTGGELIGVALGFPALALAREFARASGLKVIGLEHPNLETYNADSFVQALSKFRQVNQGFEVRSGLGLRLAVECRHINHEPDRQ